jgi:UDP-2,3-diacylglucosamine hydrolase
MIELSDEALFVADAHYQDGVREEFYDFLLQLYHGDIKADELVFMGDMFDLLVGKITYTTEKNKKLINLINQISKTKKIIYLEGNHDFSLKSIFPNLIIVPFSSQPLIIKYHQKIIALSHGDNFSKVGYRFYTLFIRNPFVLNILNFIDKFTNNSISKKILKNQENKKICKKIKNFHNLAKQKSKFYDIASNRFDLICEGHYHMDEKFVFKDVKYKFFSSFACEKVYYKMNFTEEIVFNQIKG